MSAIVLVLLESRHAVAERILAVLAAGGVSCRVRRAATRSGFAAALDAGSADVIVASSAVPGCAPAAILEDTRARVPESPIVFIADGRVDDALEWIDAGASACVPARRLDRLAPAVRRVVAEVERRRELEAAARRRDDFLARVAHQLRTPQNALLGWASLLQNRRLDEAGRARALTTIVRNARVQARMLEDLLDVSRMITGGLRLGLDPVAVEICPAVAAAVESVRPLAEEAGVILGAELDESAGAVLAEPRRLDQMVRELVTNAVRATPRAGSIDVTLSSEEGFAVIRVRDTGRGIPRETLPHVFDGLRRIDRPAPHGLGVGLWIVRHLAEAFGGTVRAESEGEGRGATFTLRLPAHVAPR